MGFRPRDLRWMVEESTTLSERLDGAVVPGAAGRSSGSAGARLRKWRERVARGDAARFEKRLRWDGLDPESALRLLGPVRLKDPHRLPAWVDVLDGAAAPRRDDTAFDRAVACSSVFDPHAPLPFEDLLWRLLAETVRDLLPRLGASRYRLSPAALGNLARGLLGRLCRTAARTLGVEFDAYRALHAGCLSLDRRANPRRGRPLHSAFVRDMERDGLAGWLLRYPMLGRLLATCCRQWTAATVDLVRRLHRDEEALRSAFGVKDRPLVIAEAMPDLSDPHRSGRAVCAIRFHSGTMLAYKPRPLALERCFSDLLERIDGMHRDLALKRPRVLDRGDYGWMEWIDATPCADPAAVERFYRRAGMLTCLAHVLGASDLHAANLIASGEHPVPIDLECLVGAPLASSYRNTADAARVASPPGSVLRTGLPPVARSGLDGTFRIAGALGAFDARPAQGHAAAADLAPTAWRGLAASNGSEPSVPVLDGLRRGAAAWMEPLLDGFRLMYRTLHRGRDHLTTAAAIRRLEHEEFRVLIRDTRTYAALLHGALTPDNLTSGPDWSIALDVLATPTLTANDRPRCWATRRAERVELERLDIPLFVGRMSEPVLRSSLGIRMEDQLDRTGYRVSTRLSLLSPDDLEQQLHLLRMSFVIAGVKRRHRNQRSRAARLSGPTRIRERFLAEIDSIVALLGRLAVDEEDTVTWRGLGGTNAASPRLDPLGLDLFAGASGIAVFLATAAAITGRRDAHDLAARVFDPLGERLVNQRRFPANLASEMGIGGATGLGGLVYALVHAGRSLGRSGYLAAASAAANGITHSAIEADDALDVLSGTAGAALGLLALHRATGDRTSLQTAIRCGEHILDNRTTDPVTGLRTWRTPPGRIATGFAHGASGIACALHRLADATGTGVFRAAATEGWTAEQQQLPRHRDRLAARCSTTRDAGARPWSWCSGEAGMGLARLDAGADCEVRPAVDPVLRTARIPGIAETDGLCCGRLGRADFLITAGLRLGRLDLCKAAETLCSETVTRALREGRYATGADEGFRPGLFQGASGIGYELLRVHAPTAVPSVLLWE